MLDIYNYFKYRSKALVRSANINKMGLLKYANSVRKYAGTSVMDADTVNQYIYQKIKSGEPFLAARFGSTELLNIRTYDFPIDSKTKRDARFQQLCKWSGFFPNNSNLLGRFTDIFKDSMKNIDIIAIWFHAFEDYYIEREMENIACTYLLNFEPWTGNVHWSAALKGKKVLVIHPFAETIEKQYQRREEIFPGTDILPKFELRTVKAVQTLAGEVDTRFKDWFEALEWMYKEAMSADFDIAIVGCGAYGMPLAAKIKSAGKQAIHLAGATQILFGIKGKRWEEDPAFAYVRKYFNDSWVYPSEDDKPKQAKLVENGCYW